MTEGEHVARQCGCGIVYTDPVPDEENLDLTIDHHHRIYYAGPAKERVQWVRRSKSGGRLLDVGCGEGEFAEIAKKFGYDVVGMEPDKKRAAVAEKRTGVPVERAFLEQDTLPASSFDIVFHVDMLSHFAHPVNSLESMRRLLRPGGVICFEVGFFSKLSPFWRRHMGRPNMPDHRWFYDEHALELTLNSAGFEIIELKKYDIGLSTLLTTALLAFFRPSSLGGRGGATDRPMASGPAGALYYRLQMWMRYQLGKHIRTGGPKTAFVTANAVS